MARKTKAKSAKEAMADYRHDEAVMGIATLAGANMAVSSRQPFDFGLRNERAKGKAQSAKKS